MQEVKAGTPLLVVGDPVDVRGVIEQFRQSFVDSHGVFCSRKQVQLLVNPTLGGQKATPRTLSSSIFWNYTMLPID